VTESGMVPVGSLLPNLGLAPLRKACWICENVHASEHVTALCFDEEGQRKDFGEAVAYLISIGKDGTRRSLLSRIATHVRHIEAYKREPYDLVPAKPQRAVSLPHTHWLSATQSAVDLGMEAMRGLAERLADGDMKDKDAIALAKLGIMASTKQGDMENRGKSLKQVDLLLMLAGGLRDGVSVIEGEAVEVP
jgi:hypothetical protein